jgi:hypothetical protein
MNLRSVGAFVNYRNDSIANVLRNEAYEEDEQGRVAYYVVKNEAGDILFFFSLKNGMLYDQYLDERKVKLLKQLYEYLEELDADAELTDADRAAVEAVKEKVRSRKGLTKKELERIPKKNAKILDDLEQELNKNITHVGRTYSGLELVHFCANSDTDGLWKAFGFPQPRGTIVFWQFIVPIVLRVRQLVGCEYLFLFAADLSESHMLFDYYQNQMGFADEGEKATAKPLYDLSCKFMYQEAGTLETRRLEFFDNFNNEE